MPCPVDPVPASARRSAPSPRSHRVFRHAVISGLAALPLLSGGHALADVPISSAAATFDLHAAASDTREPQKVCQDFFCSVFIMVPPETDVDDRSGRMEVFFNPAIASPDAERQSAAADAALGGSSGSAAAKLAIHPTSVDFGVAASAGKSSVFVGEARAALRTSYIVRVQLHTRELLGALTAGACAGGCALAMDFLHQTTGRFAYSFLPGAGARASFQEVLRIDGIARASGEAFIEADPSAGNQPSPGATGDWTAADFLAPQSTAGSTEWTFNHFAEINDQRALFFPSDQLDEDGNIVFSGQYLITVEQEAQAGFGALEYIVGTATMSADFDDTSSFTPVRLYDPTGTADLGGARVEVSFASAVPVPEPGTWGILAAGLGLTVWRLRKRPAATPRGSGAAFPESRQR